MIPSIDCSKSDSNSALLIPQDLPVSEASSDPVSKIPSEMFHQIFNDFSIREFLPCQLVCKQWNLMLNDNCLWCVLFKRDFPSVNPSTIKDFRKAYETLYSNLINGVYALHMLQGRRDMTCLVVSNGKLLLGYEDGTIEIWDAQTGGCIATLPGHEDIISCLVVFDGKLFSGSWDGTIKIWDAQTGRFITALQEHGSEVYCLAASNGKLFSSSRDGTIKIWDIQTGGCIATLRGHKDTVFCLVVSNGKLFSSSRDGTIKIWDAQTGGFITALQGHRDRVACLVFSDGKLFSGYQDGTIEIWDAQTGGCIATLQGHKNTVSHFVFSDGNLFSSSWDGTIKIWDVQTGGCITTLQACVALPHFAVADGKFFLSPYGSTIIEIWDFRASQGAIFQGITNLLEKGTPEATQRALMEFSKMPPVVKNAIYRKFDEICKPLAKDYGGNRELNVSNAIARKLYEICKLFTNNYWGGTPNDYSNCVEDAFHNRNGQSSTSAQKAQAIRDYLDDQASISTLAESPWNQN